MTSLASTAGSGLGYNGMFLDTFKEEKEKFSWGLFITF